MKSKQVKEIFKKILTEQENNWDSKERESFTIDKLLQLEWLKDGSFLKDKNVNEYKIIINKIKKCYFDYKHNQFTSNEIGGGYYVIHEPFGSKAAPDYLFITPYGIFGVEDKSSKNGSISWNTGTPGENKIITYFDKKEKKVYLITSDEYVGWTKEISIEYRKFTKDILSYADNEFKKRFGNTSSIMSKMGYYARPMLTDKNKIKDIYNPTEINVDKILKGYLDNIWENQNEPSTDNLILVEKNVNLQ